MRLASRSIWRFVSNSVQTEEKNSSNGKKLTLHLVIWRKKAASIESKSKTIFSVKSSWEVHWILMFQKDLVWFGRSISNESRGQTNQPFDLKIQTYDTHFSSIFVGIFKSSAFWTLIMLFQKGWNVWVSFLRQIAI